MSGYVRFKLFVLRIRGADVSFVLSILFNWIVFFAMPEGGEAAGRKVYFRNSTGTCGTIGTKGKDNVNKMPLVPQVPLVPSAN